MTHEEQKIITSLDKCNFKQIHKYYQEKSEERKAMSKEEKQVCEFVVYLDTHSTVFIKICDLFACLQSCYFFYHFISY